MLACNTTRSKDSSLADSDAPTPQADAAHSSLWQIEAGKKIGESVLLPLFTAQFRAALIEVGCKAAAYKHMPTGKLILHSCSAIQSLGTLDDAAADAGNA